MGLAIVAILVAFLCVGVVVGVIAVLASVVLWILGFVAASRRADESD